MELQQVSTASAAVSVTPARAATEPEPAHAPLPDAPPVRLTAAQVEQMVQEVRKVVEPVAQNLLFTVDQGTGRTVVKVVDAQTEEVIRQFPSEELLSISKALDRLQGLLLHKKA